VFRCSGGGLKRLGNHIHGVEARFSEFDGSCGKVWGQTGDDISFIGPNHLLSRFMMFFFSR
jgi:hypothetical protein